MRKWRSHFVQTFQLASRSFFQMTWRQSSHFTHRPSVRTRFSAVASISLFSRLNQDIVTEQEVYTRGRLNLHVGSQGDNVLACACCSSAFSPFLCMRRSTMTLPAGSESHLLSTRSAPTNFGATLSKFPTMTSTNTVSLS